MQWTAQDQIKAETEAAESLHDAQKKNEEWLNAIRSGKPIFGTEHAALKESLRQWNTRIDHLKSRSDAITSNESVMDSLGQLVSKLAEERATFRTLSEEVTTSTEQASSVNPKIRQSPYTNILGLNRIFRPSTQFGILIASIVFGILALIAMGYLVYIVSFTGKVVYDSPIQGGGKNSSHR